MPLIVSSDLMGRLGNQLFIIASTIGLCQKLGAEAMFPQETLSPVEWPSYSTHFGVKTLSGHELISCRIIEDQHKELDITQLSGCHVRIHGYLQKYTYFIHTLAYLRTLFNIKPPIQNGVIAVHFRFGDYLALSDYHTNLTVDYYREAFNKMLKLKAHISKFIIFSDNLQMARAVVSLCAPPLSIEYSQTNNALDDFYKMACCDSFIIANSSYSLMASILCMSEDKVVISPSENIWFGEKHRNLEMTNMIPPWYLRIDHT